MPRAARLIPLAFGMFACSAAFASLGSDAPSVQADQQALRGSIQRSSFPDYLQYEIQLDSGTKVREYVSAAGQVFAVVWDGPSMPDLKQLLGSYFAQYTEAGPGGMGPRVIDQPGLVVHSGGQMRAFHGRAYVPALVPKNMNLEQIR